MAQLSVYRSRPARENRAVWRDCTSEQFNGELAGVRDAILEAGDTEALLTARRRHKVNAALLAVSEPSERPAVVEAIQAREAAE